MTDTRHIYAYRFEPTNSDWIVLVAANTEQPGVMLTWYPESDDQLMIAMDRLQLQRFKTLIELAEHDDLMIRWSDQEKSAGNQEDERPGWLGWLVAAPGLDDNANIFDGPAS